MTAPCLQCGYTIHEQWCPMRESPKIDSREAAKLKYDKARQKVEQEYAADIVRVQQQCIHYWKSQGGDYHSDKEHFECAYCAMWIAVKLESDLPIRGGA